MNKQPEVENFGKPRIAITMGDPAGVGPELCLLALQNAELQRTCIPIVFGDATLLQRCSDATGLSLDAAIVKASEPAQEQDWRAQISAIDRATVLDFQYLSANELSRFKPGVLAAAAGGASFQFVQRSIDAALAGAIQAVVTGPINKEAIHAAGHDFPGHTEIFAQRCDASRSCMMQFSDAITCTFVTTHCGYAEVPKLLTIQRIVDVIELTVQAIRKLRNNENKEPRLVVCGLNPHAGEHGLFGDREEERIIIPAIERARRQGIVIEGPLPPDTAFVPAKRATTDAFICMYHDQGHIPVKALAFDSAVNTTLGLKIIRTSVDHGTAFDIAWQNKVNPGSLYAALELAVRLM